MSDRPKLGSQQSTLTETFYHIMGGLDPSFLNLEIAQRQYFQQRHGFLSLLVTLDILYHHLGQPILGNDHGLHMFHLITNNLGSMGLQITNRLDLTGEFQVFLPFDQT